MAQGAGSMCNTNVCTLNLVLYLLLYYWEIHKIIIFIFCDAFLKLHLFKFIH